MYSVYIYVDKISSICLLTYKKGEITMRYYVECRDKDMGISIVDSEAKAVELCISLEEKYKKYNKQFTYYPEEPEEVIDDIFPGMCESCGRNPAVSGDFICMECASKMLVDMEGDTEE